MSTNNEWNELNNKIINCQKCSLHKTCIQPIPGDGPADARIFIVGEAPGRKEDEQHIPFVGASGKLLNKQLERIGLYRDNVYITNIVKCRPTLIDSNGKTQNRTPKPEEREICSPYLTKQLLLAKPIVLITLGRVSGDFYRPECNMGTNSEIMIEDKEGNSIKINHFAVYHPAYCIYNRSNLPNWEKHFDKLRLFLKNNKIKLGPIKKNKGVSKNLSDFF